MLKVKLSALPKELEQLLPVNVQIIRQFYFNELIKTKEKENTSPEEKDNL